MNSVSLTPEEARSLAGQFAESSGAPSAHRQAVETFLLWWQRQDRQAGEATIRELERVLEVWGLSRAEAATHFGVSRQAISKWFKSGLPSERATMVADLAATTDLLERHLKAGRIPAVVRRPAERLDGRTLVELLAEEGSGAVLRACREMFSFERAHG